MFVLDDRLKGFKIRQIWFDDMPHDIKGLDKVMFYFCKDENAAAPPGFNTGRTRFREIDMSRQLQDIYKGFHRDTRRRISQADAESPRFEINKDYDDFTDMLNDFLKRKGAVLPTKVAKEQLTQCEHILATIYHDGKLIDGHYFAIDNGFANMVFSCSRRLDDSDTAKIIGNYSRYLIYKAIEHAKISGVKRLSLGVIPDDNMRSIAAFKESFGGVERVIPFYTKTYSAGLRVLESVRNALR